MDVHESHRCASPLRFAYVVQINLPADWSMLARTTPRMKGSNTLYGKTTNTLITQRVWLTMAIGHLNIIKCAALIWLETDF